MKHEPIGPKPRRATNITLPENLIAEARTLEVNVSQACETGLAAAVRAERARRFQEEHRGRIEAWNAWFEQNGLPFADLRVF